MSLKDGFLLLLGVAALVYLVKSCRGRGTVVNSLPFTGPQEFVPSANLKIGDAIEGAFQFLPRG